MCMLQLKKQGISVFTQINVYSFLTGKMSFGRVKNSLYTYAIYRKTAKIIIWMSGFLSWGRTLHLFTFGTMKLIVRDSWPPHVASSIMNPFTHLNTSSARRKHHGMVISCKTIKFISHLFISHWSLHKWTVLSLVQVMVWFLFGAKPFTDQMLIYCYCTVKPEEAT